MFFRLLGGMILLLIAGSLHSLLDYTMLPSDRVRHEVRRPEVRR